MAIENSEVFVKLKMSVFPFSSSYRIVIRDPWWTLAYFCVSFLGDIQELYDKIYTYLRARLLYYLFCTINTPKTNSKVSS